MKPLQSDAYRVIVSASSRWQPILDDDAVIETAIERLALVGIIELRTEAEIATDSRDDVLTATYRHSGGVTTDDYRATHIQALAAAGWSLDSAAVITPRITHLRLAADHAEIEVAGADREALAKKLVDSSILDGRHYAKGFCRLESVDSFLPASWFKETTGVQPERLRTAAKRGQLISKGEGKGTRYSKAGFKRLWPQDAVW